MTRAERRVVRAMDEILNCVCILAGQANNYSGRLNEQIFKAQTALKACAALSRAKASGKRR